MRADSGFYTHTVVAVCRRMDVRFSITIRQRTRLRNLIEAIPEEDWTPIPYWMDGADVAETTYKPVSEVLRQTWLAAQVMAHNLARWTARIGLGQQIVTTKTLRRRFFALAGRLTRSARRLTLHLPRRWPWEEQFSRALARLRAIPFPA